MGVDFFTRVRNAYLERARKSPKRFLIVDAEQTPGEVEKRILEGVSGWL